MKKVNLILSLVLSVALFSCDSKNSESENFILEEHVSEEEEAHHHEHSEEMSEIELNNGEKWAVNEEMKPYVENAETLLNDYVKNQSEDFKNLATQLKDENKKLIKSCTMEGQSHEELHKWLYPHIELLDALEVAENTESATKIVEELQHSFATYHQYFD
ncbi:MAG: hypothetical protein PHC38_04485 [Weeksellaceae bacterium]|nr:hypothetical protein [Weeksellaceae bacterium]